MCEKGCFQHLTRHTRDALRAASLNRRVASSNLIRVSIFSFSSPPLVLLFLIQIKLTRSQSWSPIIKCIKFEGYFVFFQLKCILYDLQTVNVPFKPPKTHGGLCRMGYGTVLEGLTHVYTYCMHTGELLQIALSCTNSVDL